MDEVWTGERYPVMACFVGKRMLTLPEGNKPGPDRATTTVGEDVSLSLRAGGKVSVCFWDTRKFTDEWPPPAHSR